MHVIYRDSYMLSIGGGIQRERKGLLQRNTNIVWIIHDFQYFTDTNAQLL